MEIKTKFSIGDLIRRKTDRITKDELVVLEVMDIDTNSCYAGTQVFYACRALVAEKKYDKYIHKDGDPFTWLIRHGGANHNNSSGLTRYREDEIVDVPVEERQVFASESKA